MTTVERAREEPQRGDTAPSHQHAAAASPARRAPAPRLVVGAIDDTAEREADAIAANVMRALRTPEATPPASAAAPSPADRIRRAPDRASDPDQLDEADPDGEDTAAADVAALAATSSAAPSDGNGSDATIDRSPAPHIRRAAHVPAAGPATGTGPDGGLLDGSIAQRVQRSVSGGRPIDAPVQARIQRAFRTDLSGVRVHADAAAGDLSRDLNARAFTVGRDVFFGKGEYRPNTDGGLNLLAHELAHVEQASGIARRARPARRTVIRRKFRPAVVRSKAHLRQRDAWGTFHGPAIPPGTMLFTDDNAGNQIVQRRTVLPNVTWVPTVNADPHAPAVVPGDRQGYIRAERIAPWGASTETLFRRQIKSILADAEQRTGNDQLAGKLATDEHVDFLADKSLRLDSWNPDAPQIGVFAGGVGSLPDKLDRIREGAEHVADSLEHWRKWLDPQYPDLVDIIEVKLLGSDLHEHGLGVVSAKFSKLPGSGQVAFRGDRDVEAIIKPEDKSLEKELLGAQDDSAVNQLNQIADLTGNEQLGSIRMEVADIAPQGLTPVYSTLVERIQGRSSEDRVGGDTTKKGKGKKRVIPAFHETLVFAWLAGIDDLHWENVMWVNDVPYLIDADSVMMKDQMEKTGTGDQNQSGFSTVNKKRSDNTREGIKRLDPAKAKSKLLDKVINDKVARTAALKAIKDAIAGHKGRTVPIYTAHWGQRLRFYASGTQQDKDGHLNECSQRRFLVGEGRTNDGQGPGLSGTTGVNPDDDFYDGAAERAQLRRDFDAGVVPFYEYDYDTGHVTHNGAKVFHGLTIDHAFDALTTKLGG